MANSYPTNGAPKEGAEYPFDDILKQVNFLSPEEISKKATGLQIARKVYDQQTGQRNNLNYFAARAIRWINILQWATGTQDMTQFLDFFNVSDGNKAYVKIDMTPIMLGPQFVGTLVESMAKNEEYPCVTAVDDDSKSEKENRKTDALYRMHDQQTIGELQKMAGTNLEPPNAYVPDDELSAEVYFQLEDRLPKEIETEEKLQNTLIYNDYERVLKRKFIYDNVVFNIEVGKIERDKGEYFCIRRCLPQNTFYNYIIGDTGRYELSYIGEVYNLKVRDIRSKYGESPENPNGLSEKEIYELARMSSTQNIGVGFNYLWREEYAFYNFNRPWDDYSIYCMDFEIQVNTSDYYVNKVDSFGKDNISPKQSRPEPKSDKATILKKNKNRWYRGVYAPYANKLIYWGLPDIVLFDYSDTDEGMSSYAINIPNNNGEYVPSLFERAMEPLKEYALTKLKRKQLIAKLRPSGIRIDVESARNIDLGGGNIIPWEEVVRIYDQTGNELWSSRGINPNEREAPPIGTTAQDDTINKIIQLTTVLKECIMDIRGLLGVPPYLDGGQVGDRTANALAENQNENSFNVTGFILNSHNQFMEQLLYKVCIAEWQKMVKKGKNDDKNYINSKFQVYVRMKTTAYEKQLLDQNIQIAMRSVDASGKPLLTFKDAFKIRNIQNYKLAELYLANMVETNEKKAQQQSMQLQQQNATVQAQAAQQAAEQQQAMAQQQAQADAIQKDQELRRAKELKLLEIVGNITDASITKGVDIPEMWQPLIAQVIQNVSIPMVVENQQMKAGIQQAAQQQMEPQEQEEPQQ